MKIIELYSLLEMIRRELGGDYAPQQLSILLITAVASAVYLSLLGAEGLKELGNNLLARAHYLAKQIDEIEGINVPMFDASFFREFCIGFKEHAQFEPEPFEDYMLEHRIFGGLPVSTKENPNQPDALLISVSEKHDKVDLNLFVKALSGFMGGD